MIKALLSILNVVEGEEKPVLLLLGYGFFMGIFLATYKIVATTLFLNQLSDHIREAFFVSGILGVVPVSISKLSLGPAGAVGILSSKLADLTS